MRATPDSTFANPEQRIADLQRQLIECRAELDKAQRYLDETTTERDEALAREAATAEVLQVINSSPSDLAPVFDAILEKAHSLCGAEFGSLFLYDGERFRAIASHGVPEALASRLREGIGANDSRSIQQLIAGEPFAHIHDSALEERAVYRGMDMVSSHRTLLSVPLRKSDALLGMIVAGRLEVQPFTDKQIALLQNFAAQAVIAIENARLLRETREALEQQTATAEILRVISASPTDLQPTLNAIAARATILTGAASGSVSRFDGSLIHPGAYYGWTDEEIAAVQRDYPRPPGMESTTGRAIVTREVVHVPDARTDPEYGLQSVLQMRMRTGLSVPILQDGNPVGAITVTRREVEPFSLAQIDLLKTFADQVVIAIENVRLFNETKEALEQQTATAEVLQVINSSPGDLTPVFDAILEKAHKLCDIEFGTLQLYDGEQFRILTRRGFPENVGQSWRDPYSVAPNSPLGALLKGEPLAEIPDVIAYQAQTPNRRAEAAIAVGIRSVLFLPLRRDNLLLGVISAGRKEVKPFQAKEIALLQNFAAQAVIAMENARLLTETREALEQQTATAEVLQVINSSPGDLTPVFDAILEKAMRLCEVAFGVLFTPDGEHFHAVVARGVPPSLEEYLRHPFTVPPGSTFDELVSGVSVVQLPDVGADDRPASDARRAAVELGGARTALAVALRKDDEFMGAFFFYRQEVRPFTEKQIALLQNFAAQAVIAMENARLLNELQDRTHDLEESLEYQTATSDVLQVISRSTFDLQPVLDTLVQTAAGLCSADMGLISGREEDGMRVTATFSTTPEYEAFIRGRLLPLTRGSLGGRVFVERKAVQIPDLTADPEFTVTETVTLGKMRTALGVPLMREGEVIGAISLARQRVEPFTQRQIELVRTFADQAVIAIENTRLITETREALEQQTATAEILQVINSSPGDLAPVYAAILEKAHLLCGVAVGTLQLYDGTKVRTVAQRGVTGRWAELMQEPYEPAPGHPAWRLLGGERIVHILDHGVGELAKQQPENPRAQASAQQGLRTALWVPLRKDAELLGYITTFRQEVRLFSEKQIALMESFAAQAVIAMDNARLLNEIRQRQAELRVTFDNMGDGVAMFDGEQRLAAWNLNFQRILDLPDALLAERPRVEEFVRYLATHGEYGAVEVEAEVRRLVDAVGTEFSTERTRPDGRVIEVRSNPVPGGGVVLIYSDVTERKRAEAEIRAARDTAEKALQELQTTQASLVHAQKMAALGQLTAGIAHEIKNPLNFVNNFAELSGELLLELKETTAPAVAALGDDERAAVDEVVEMLRSNLDKIAEHGKRADGIVKSMLEHSRGVSGECRAVDLNALIEEALNLAYHGARAQDASFNITLERDFDRGLAPTELAPQEITRVFLNLFGNSFYATTRRQRDGAAPEFRPILKVATRDFGDAVEVRVRDNGTGIAPEIRDKLFQPFVTTKPTGEGTGLGLSIAYDIITQQHGGTIDVDSRIGEFTEFTIRLPRTRLTTADAAS